MWKKSENSESVMPKFMEVSGNSIILRRNFRFVEATEMLPEHYEYEECQMTKEQFEIYKVFESRLKEQDDALIELAGLIAEGA